MAAASSGATVKKTAAKSVPLLGLYFGLKDKMSLLEPMLQEFYVDLLRKLGLVGSQSLMLDGKEQVLTEDLMQLTLENPVGSKLAAQGKLEQEDFTLFRGGYIRLFEDGSVFQEIMYRVFEQLGEAKIVWIRWKSEYQLSDKSNPKLRTFYRFVDVSFISQLPVDPYMAFTVDALLYCKWRCAHPNLIGFHLVMLAWMLNVRDFDQFIPASIMTTKPIANRLLKLFWPRTGLKFHLTTNPQASSKTAAYAAKGVYD